LPDCAGRTRSPGELPGLNILTGLLQALGNTAGGVEELACTKVALGEPDAFDRRRMIIGG
jgi:hypothetical protein